MDYLEGKAATKVVNGLVVEKAAISKAAASTKSLFNVVGGRVILKNIILEITTVFAAGANNTNLVHTPTGGAEVALCAVLDTDADAEGLMYSISGLAATALLEGLGAVTSQTYDMTLKAGVIGLKTAGNTTGAVKATLVYIPLDTGAYVEAA